MGRTCLVLVVEDEPDIAVLIDLSLDPARYEVLMADSLAAARAILASGRPVEAIVLDRLLPDGDGLDLCGELKAAGRPIPVVVVTARATSDEEAQAAGAERCILKPFDPDELQAVLDAVCAGPGSP